MYQRQEWSMYTYIHTYITSVVVNGMFATINVRHLWYLYWHNYLICTSQTYFITYTTPESLIQCSIHLACSYLLMMLKYIWEGGRTNGWGMHGWGIHADFGAALDSRKPFYISKEVIKNSQKNHDSWIMVLGIICCIICGLETILSYNKEEDDSWLMFLIAFYTL